MHPSEIEWKTIDPSSIVLRLKNQSSITIEERFINGHWNHAMEFRTILPGTQVQKLNYSRKWCFVGVTGGHDPLLFSSFCYVLSIYIIGRWGLQQIQMKTKQLKHHRICLNIHFVTKKFMTRKCAICTNTVNSIQIFSDKSTAAVNLMKISNIQTCGWARVANAAFPWRTFKNFNLT